MVLPKASQVIEPVLCVPASSATVMLLEILRLTLPPIITEKLFHIKSLNLAHVLRLVDKNTILYDENNSVLKLFILHNFHETIDSYKTKTREGV